MATQTIEFAAPSGQTISTVRLFAAGSDTIVDTAAATERTNSKLIYRASFTDLPAGRYRLIAINSNSSPLAAYWVDTLAATGTYYAYDLTPTQVEDAVWDATQSAHTTAGTMGKTLDTLRKSNPVVEGTVLANPAPTATTFSVSGLAYPTGAFNKSVLWFADDASIAEQNSPIATFVNNGDGTQTITLQDPLTTAPTAGDGILIDPTSHVHTIAEIQSGLATLSNQTTILARLGAFTGTGINTVLGFLRAMASKVASTPSDIGGTFTANTDSLEAIRDASGSGGGSATLENQELILDEIDSLRSAFATAVGRLAVASQIIGFPTVLVRNSDYSTITESEIRLSLNDLDGNPITEIGGVACASIDWLFGIGSERAPQLIEGAATWDAGTNQLVIQIDAEDTSTTPLGSLSWQIGCTIGTTTRFLGGGTTRLIERQF